MKQPNQLSIITPTLNEGQIINTFLNQFHPFHQRSCELIIVDAYSEDNTLQAVKQHQAKYPNLVKVIQTEKGRAQQMNTGAQIASGNHLVFLHADTKLPPNADHIIHQSLTEQTPWGHFHIHLNNKATIYRLIEALINRRSKFSKIATGDQAIFTTKQFFTSQSGFPEQPLMEDIEWSKLCKKTTKPLCSKYRVTTSTRRWEQNGIWRTIWLMWKLRLQYALGTPAEKLAKKYN